MIFHFDFSPFMIYFKMVNGNQVYALQHMPKARGWLLIFQCYQEVFPVPWVTPNSKKKKKKSELSKFAITKSDNFIPQDRILLPKLLPIVSVINQQ